VAVAHDLYEQELPMKGLALGLSLSVAFILGCLAAPFLVPRLSAQHPTNVRWEHYCETFSRLGSLNEFLQARGQQGWELATDYPGGRTCVKRPLR